MADKGPKVKESSPRGRRSPVSGSPRSTSPRPGSPHRNEASSPQRAPARPPTAPARPPAPPPPSSAASSARTAWAESGRPPVLNGGKAGGRNSATEGADEGDSGRTEGTEGSTETDEDLAQLQRGILATLRAAAVQDPATALRELQRLHARLTGADGSKALNSLEVLWQKQMQISESKGKGFARAAGPSALLGAAGADALRGGDVKGMEQVYACQRLACILTRSTAFALLPFILLETNAATGLARAARQSSPTCPLPLPHTSAPHFDPTATPSLPNPTQLHST